jgi:hypothetical protein
LKTIWSIVSLSGIIVLFLSAVIHRPKDEFALAQATRPDSTKENQDQKKTSPGFEDDQGSAMCVSATGQAKLIASIVETYSRRLSACVISNPNFRDDCSGDFGRLVKGYNQYQFAVSSVRNYCR